MGKLPQAGRGEAPGTDSTLALTPGSESQSRRSDLAGWECFCYVYVLGADFNASLLLAWRLAQRHVFKGAAVTSVHFLASMGLPFFRRKWARVGSGG